MLLLRFCCYWCRYSVDGASTANDCVDCVSGTCPLGTHAAVLTCPAPWSFVFDADGTELSNSCIHYNATAVIWDKAKLQCEAVSAGAHLLTSRQVLRLSAKSSPPREFPCQFYREQCRYTQVCLAVRCRWLTSVALAPTCCR